MTHTLFYSYPPGSARLFAAAVWLACVAGVASAGRAMTPASLVTDDLNAQDITLASMRDGVVSYFDAKRTLRSAAVEELVQLRAIGGEPAPVGTALPCVLLTDGQRFTGRWLGPASDGSALRWRHELLGELLIPLDEVAEVIWRDDASADAVTAAPTGDTLTLNNGDTLGGFVAAMDEAGVSLIPDGASDAVTIPYERIAALTLANPPRAVSEPYHRVTLADGSRVWADELSLTGESASWLSMPPGASSRMIESPIDELSRIDLRTGGLRLADLTELPMRVEREPVVFGLAVPVRVDGRAIYAHAPATLVFELPQGASRFAVVAELDVSDAPETYADWSDLQVVAVSGGQEVGRWQVTGSEPSVRINAEITGRTLEIRLEAGVNGPILDRLRLTDAVVLVRVEPAEQTGVSGR